MAHAFTPHECKILRVLAAAEFVNVLDFMMVMPMGPDLGRPLGMVMASFSITMIFTSRVRVERSYRLGSSTMRPTVPGMACRL
jgi:hypothetical protein